MTNKERLISLLGFSPNENAITGEMLDGGIDPDDDYEVTNSIPIKKCAINIMEMLLTTADTSNNDGYSIKYDRQAVENRIKLFKTEIGLIDSSQPTIKGISPW